VYLVDFILKTILGSGPVYRNTFSLQPGLA
jgi:hypothetical protein